MPRRIQLSTLNANTITILNTIRANAPAQYQKDVPVVTSEKDVPKVGDVIYGNSAHSNTFISALVNRIALVDMKSMTFNNPYAQLKKGYIDMGESIEEVFVELAKAREFSAEKAEAREFKRTLPDVRTAFHTMNYRTQYPITIQDEDLRQAFLSIDGVTDLIAKIINSVYVAEQYDEFLLFKYLIIKGVTHGAMFPVQVSGSDLSQDAIAYRGMSGKLQFPSTLYNADGVHVTTPVEDQYIFMDTEYNACFDVSVLASAFNMDKTTFMGKLNLIDDWGTFDNDRFAEIRENSDQLELVTAEELAITKDITAVLVDKEWFQVYDNVFKMTEDQVAAGMYWNYFLNVWKTVSYSPFSNAIVFVKNTISVELPQTIDVVISSLVRDEDTGFKQFALNVSDTIGIVGKNLKFVQTEQATKDLVAINPYGAVAIPSDVESVALVVDVDGTQYTGGTLQFTGQTVGDSITLTKVSE